LRESDSELVLGSEGGDGLGDADGVSDESDPDELELGKVRFHVGPRLAEPVVVEFVVGNAFVGMTEIKEIRMLTNGVL